MSHLEAAKAYISDNFPSAELLLLCSLSQHLLSDDDAFKVGRLNGNSSGAGQFYAVLQERPEERLRRHTFQLLHAASDLTVRARSNISTFGHHASVPLFPKTASREDFATAPTFELLIVGVDELCRQLNKGNPAWVSIICYLKEQSAEERNGRCQEGPFDVGKLEVMCIQPDSFVTLFRTSNVRFDDTVYHSCCFGMAYGMIKKLRHNLYGKEPKSRTVSRSSEGSAEVAASVVRRSIALDSLPLPPEWQLLGWLTMSLHTSVLSSASSSLSERKQYDPQFRRRAEKHHGTV